MVSSRSVRRRWLFRGIYSVYVFLLGFLAFRGYIWWTYGVSPTDLSNRFDVYKLQYPELFQRGIIDSRVRPDKFRILLLGGSVAEQTGSLLQSRMVTTMGIPVCIHNAALSAHTTQDSLNKLTCLTERGAEFDLILIYHGINDVRMNCVAPEEFRNDYTHCAWYASFEKRKRDGSISATDSFRESLARMIGLGEPAADHVAFGAQIKTGPAFRDHLQQMLKLADNRHVPVVLMTFATHFVDDYSRDAFLAKKLGYADGQYVLPTEIWGESDNVRRGVAVHNDVIRQLATERPESLFIDVQSELTGIENFTDVCHLSPVGIQKFADIVSAQLSGLLMPEVR